MDHKYRFFHRARVRAPIEIAWDVLTDHERMGEFTNSPCTIATPGAEDRNGLGCIRVLGTHGWKIREIVNIWRPLEVYGYHVIDSPQILAHQGVVRFFALADGGCEWVYDMQNIPAQSTLDQAEKAGLTYQEFLGTGFRAFMASLEAECERRADGERIPSAPPSTSEHALFE